jgi:hypothetical protein
MGWSEKALWALAGAVVAWWLLRNCRAAADGGRKLIPVQTFVAAVPPRPPAIDQELIPTSTTSTAAGCPVAPDGGCA